MEAVKVWSFSMCGAVVVGSIVTMIVPSIEKQKIMKIIISAFILIGVVSPLLNVIDEIDISEQVVNQSIIESSIIYLDENSFNELENGVSQAIYPLVQGELDKMNVKAEFGINTELEQQEEGISIKCVNINIADLHMIEKEKIKASIEKNLGLEINIESSIIGEMHNNE